MVVDISPALRDDLLAYLLSTSPDRARLIAELTARNPGIADLLMDLESDDNLRAKLEMELLSGAGDSEQPQWITSGEGSPGFRPGISSWPCSISRPAARSEA